MNHSEIVSFLWALRISSATRLNRTHPDKQGTIVLDFANESDEIKAAFDPYYETTLLSEATDPNLLYQVRRW